jgi:hypothetical protein
MNEMGTTRAPNVAVNERIVTYGTLVFK